ncbi:Similar to v1g245966: Ribosomal RNA processing protein 36 homolog (Nematostella vectensis) [Cotesia congregata]|uniref:rRNA biogenesis protein RRP36 n=1 Tax=Cotesia congregata TaxID=51543 RepID=A0A8J2HKX9_COTCN|nr:Similar to v1g245966: Ribosomal RNA processing protein 36 homolog (Nematostella vectensis) [Cotesia congregata]
MSSDIEETPFLEDEEAELIKEVSRMNPEELRKLKNELGTKIFNKIIQKKNSTKPSGKYRVPQPRARNDDDRPVEVSAKRKVPPLMNVVPVKKPVARDPRFDKLCGEFNERAFKKSYSFVSQLKENDIKALKKELKRLENQLREERKVQKHKEAEEAEKKQIAEAIKRGEQPMSADFTEKKIIDLVSQYEELKSSGKLQKHIERLKKKRLSKDRKKGLSHDNNEDNDDDE